MNDTYTIAEAVMDLNEATTLEEINWVYDLCDIHNIKVEVITVEIA